jgi:Uma2 family endonuclease
MIQATSQLATFEDFVAIEDSDELHEYELINGRLVLMPEPDDWHEEILELLSFIFELQYRQHRLNYSVRKRNALMLDQTRERRPDIAVIERPNTRREERPSEIRSRPHMIVEIASGNGVLIS